MQILILFTITEYIIPQHFEPLPACSILAPRVEWDDTSSPNSELVLKLPLRIRLARRDIRVLFSRPWLRLRLAVKRLGGKIT